MAKLISNPVWKNEPDKHDYPAAANYLSLIADDAVVADIVAMLKKAPITTYKAKDILRASGLALLPVTDIHVAADLAKVVSGIKLSPVLLVRGGVEQGVPTTIADGYHRVRASYYIGDNTDIPARIVDLPIGRDPAPEPMKAKKRK